MIILIILLLGLRYIIIHQDYFVCILGMRSKYCGQTVFLHVLHTVKQSLKLLLYCILIISILSVQQNRLSIVEDVNQF